MQAYVDQQSGSQIKPNCFMPVPLYVPYWAPFFPWFLEKAVLLAGAQAI
jgi:hypothetical protein